MSALNVECFPTLETGLLGYCGLALQNQLHLRPNSNLKICLDTMRLVCEFDVL